MKVGSFFKRVLRAGFVNFWRNGIVSLASVLIMTVTLTLFSFLIFSNAVLNFSLTQIKDRVDMTIYFYPTATQDEVDSLRAFVEELPEVEETVFISSDEALANFTERHSNDQLVLQALEELGDNPLGASLNVKAYDPAQYETIANLLEGPDALVVDVSSIIERINYRQNQEVIERLNNLIRVSQTIALGISIIFILMSIIITYNTIRLAIHAAQEEIEVMRLVGADNHYIRGPFLMSGLLYGIVSAILAMVILYPLTLWAGRFTEDFFGGFNLYWYYADNLVQMSLVLIVSGALLGAISSVFATSRYLKK
jgi:cell division transport system permease protein